MKYTCPLCAGPADCPIGHMYLCNTPGCKNGPEKSELQKSYDIAMAADVCVSMSWMYVIPCPGYPVPVSESRNPDNYGHTIHPFGNSFFIDPAVPRTYLVYEVHKTAQGPRKVKLGLAGYFYCRAYERVEVNHDRKTILIWRRDP